MNLEHVSAVVTGGASGLGEATVRNIVKNGGKAAILDLQVDRGEEIAAELNEHVIFAETNVADEASVQHALDQAVRAHGSINTVVNCAGIGNAEKTFSDSKGPHKLENFSKILEVNLMGTFNVIRLAAEKMNANDPNDEGERGVIINTASVAAYEGQIGQVAYSASKGGIVGMTLPIARDLSKLGIRVLTIAPGLLDTPLFAALPEKARDALGKMTPFPQRLGYATEYAMLAKSLMENPMMNGEVIRLDGAIRMQPE
ncbi:3-hydroxyacyl-CoA dehydrogenase [Barrientosiimonas marina]|uniref:3-hydroxyacyl-CoA dehydrogenase n=1 Tax=Lentibacillus kimchii TaxID=1542911 RepID=A0ABW2UTR6_9BACI